MIAALAACSNGSKETKGGAEDPESIAADTVGAESFTAFYERFITDSAFQISRIPFPIKGKYRDPYQEYGWARESWGFQNLRLSDIDTTQYTVKVLQTPTRVVESVKAKEGGFSYTMEYRLMHKKWYVIFREENNL